MCYKMMKFNVFRVIASLQIPYFMIDKIIQASGVTKKLGYTDTIREPYWLCFNDPLCKYPVMLFPKSNWKSNWKTVLLVLIIYGIFMGLGYLVALDAIRRGEVFLSLTNNDRELFSKALYFLLYSPFIWGAYTWQARKFSDVLRQLQENGVLGKRTSTEKLRPLPLRNLLISIPIGVAFLGLLLWEAVARCPNNPYCQGQPKLWTQLEPYSVLWNTLLFSNIYMLIWMIVRQVIAVKEFSRFFQEYEIRPQLLHKDGRNGFAPIGDFAVGSTIVALFVGLWLAFITIGIGYVRFSSYLAVVSSLMYFVFLIAVPFFLIQPAWEAHKVMAKNKDETLESIASEMRPLLENSEKEEIMSFREYRCELDARYQMISKALHIWPFRFTLEKTLFYVGYLLTILSIISVVLTVYTTLFAAK